MMLPWGAGRAATRGEYDWSQADALIRETTNRGIEPFPFLYGSPGWAAEQDGWPCSGNDCAVYPPRSTADRGRVRRLRRGRRRALRARAASSGGAVNRARRDVEGDRPGACPVPVLCPPPPPPPPPPDPPLPPASRPAAAPSRARSSPGRSGTSRTRPSTSPRSRVSALYADMLKRAGDAIHAVDPGGRDRPRRDVGPELGAKGWCTPVKPYLKRLYARQRDRAELRLDRDPPVRRRRRGLDRPARDGARAWSSRPATRASASGSREIGWAAGGPRSNPYVKGLTGQARVLTRALTEYEQQRRSLRPARGVLVLVARQEGRRRDLRLVRRRGPAIEERQGEAGVEGVRRGSRAGDPGAERPAGRPVGALALIAPPRPCPRAAVAVPDELLRRRPAGAARATPTTSAWARRASACCGSSSTGRRSSRAAAATTTGRPPTPSSASAARARHPRAAVRLRRPEPGSLDAWRPRVRPRRLPAVRADRARAALAAWGRFLAAAVDRYGPNGSFWAEHPELPRLPIRAWQIWNEQNSPTFYAPKPNVRAYAELLAAAHDAIAARDPGARDRPRRHVRHPPRRPEAGDRRPRTSSRRLYRRPGGGAGLRRRRPASVRRRARRGHGADRPAPRRDRARRRRRRALDHRARLGLGRLAEPARPRPARPGGAPSRGVPRTSSSTAGGCRIENVAWYSWRDSSPASERGLCDWCPQSGLLEPDGTPKPALDAFTDAHRWQLALRG